LIATRVREFDFSFSFRLAHNGAKHGGANAAAGNAANCEEVMGKVRTELLRGAQKDGASTWIKSS
jgi:hypothetical protein